MFSPSRFVMSRRRAGLSAETEQTMTVQLNDLMLKDGGCHYGGAERTPGVVGRYDALATTLTNRQPTTNRSIAARDGRGRRRPGGEQRERRRGRTETKEETGGANGRPDARERKVTSLGWWENVSRECTGDPRLLQMMENGLLCDEAFVPLWWPVAHPRLPASDTPFPFA
ncbi:hypothetical protein LZ30DRAFT_294971 [Colletotrichum cereale]|nr:hypothetical protein LZ30DRAFT_294971 [Colletotrichum cereale]